MQDKKSVQLSSDDGRYVEVFATKLFMKADMQERRGKATLNTAKTFYAASLFFEILHNFGDLPFDVEKKQKYAAWKAAEIRKALKKVWKPLRDLPASDKAFPVSDGEVFNPESPSEKLSADSLEQSVSLERSPTVGLEIDAERDQFPFSTNQSSEHSSDPRFILDTQSGGTVSRTSNCNQQDSSDDDQSFYDCSEEPDDDVLFSNDTGTGLDQTISTPADVQGQVYHPSGAEIADNDLRFSSNTASVLDRMISISVDVQGQHYHPSAAEIVKALKVSRFAVSALAFDDVPSAVSYLKQALDLLTNPPQTQS